MSITNPTNTNYKYYNDGFPFSDRATDTNTIITITDITYSKYKNIGGNVVIKTTPLFHTNVSMKDSMKGFKIDGATITPNASPRLIFNSNNSTGTDNNNTVPQGCTHLYVILWGAGGGGGGGAYDNDGSAGNGAAGGGSGQCIGALISNPTFSTFNVTTGVGGDPGLGGGTGTYSSGTTSGNAGSDGGNTSFSYTIGGTTTTYTAAGGKGGGKGKNGAASDAGGAGGSGGSNSNTDPNSAVNGNTGITNNGNSGGAGGQATRFGLAPIGFTAYDVTAVAGKGETGTGSEAQEMNSFTRPVDSDGMRKGAGGAGGDGDNTSATGGFTGVPGGNGWCRVYAYFDGAAR